MFVHFPLLVIFVPIYPSLYLFPRIHSAQTDHRDDQNTWHSAILFTLRHYSFYCRQLHHRLIKQFEWRSACTATFFTCVRFEIKIADVQEKIIRLLRYLLNKLNVQDQNDVYNKDHHATPYYLRTRSRNKLLIIKKTANLNIMIISLTHYINLATRWF